MLPFYGERLTAVEAHSTHRQLPKPAALDRWIAQVPEHFRFAPKAHANLTHQRDLSGLGERMARFMSALEPLGPRLGPVLFVLPHREPDLERLDALLGALPRPPLAPAVFELGPAWHTPEVIERIVAGGASLAGVDSDPAGPVAYVRLRAGSYGGDEIGVWASRLAGWTTSGRPTYAFLKHDAASDGPRYAQALVDRLDHGRVSCQLGRRPTGAFEVARRDRDAGPVVIRNAPLLDDGTPMPTRYWLVDERLRRAVSALEAGGGVRLAEAEVDPAELAAAHERYGAERLEALPPGHAGPVPSGGVGGTARGVKCLHAHYAWYLCGGDDPVGRWVEEHLPGTWPGTWP